MTDLELCEILKKNNLVQVNALWYFPEVQDDWVIQVIGHGVLKACTNILIDGNEILFRNLEIYPYNEIQDVLDTLRAELSIKLKQMKHNQKIKELNKDFIGEYR